MPLVKPQSPSLQLAHRLAKGLVGAWVMSEGAGLRSRDSSPSRLDTTFAGSTPPTWAMGPTGPIIVYNINAYSTLLVNTIPAAVPASFGTIGAVGSTYTIVSRILTTNALAIGATAPWSFGGCLFEARNTGTSVLAHAWSVGVESGRWGTARTNNIGSSTGQRILSAVTLVNDNLWHDVAAVVNGNAVSLYIDGRLDTASIFNNANSTADCSVSTGTGNVYVEIAARSTNAAGYASAVTGSVAFCYVYNRALSRDEISALATDPFQMFRAPSRVPFFVILPSGPTTTTLTVSRYNNSNIFRTDTLKSVQNLTAIRYSDLDTFRSATLKSIGKLTPNRFIDADTFRTANLKSTRRLTPNRYSDLDTFRTATLKSTRRLTTTHYISPDTYFTTVIKNNQNFLNVAIYRDLDTFRTVLLKSSKRLTTSRYSDLDSFKTAALKNIKQLAATRFVDVDRHFTITLKTAGAISAARYIDPDIIYNTVVSYRLTTTRFDSENIFYDADLAPGVYALSSQLFADPDKVYASTVEFVFRELAASLYVNPNLFYRTRTLGGKYPRTIMVGSSTRTIAVSGSTRTISVSGSTRKVSV